MAIPTPPTLDYNASVNSYIAGRSVTDQINYEYAQEVVMQRESAFPFLAFQLKQRQATALTSVIFWHEMRPRARQDNVTADVNAGAAGAAVTVPVANPTWFNVGDVCEVPNVALGALGTSQFIVTAISGSNLTVYPYDGSASTANVPAMSGSSPAAGDNPNNVAGTLIQILFNSYEQGGTSIKAVNVRPTRQTNQTTISRHAYQVAKTTDNERLFFNMNERALQRNDTQIQHLTEMNVAAYFGKGVTGDSGAVTGNITGTGGGSFRTAMKGFEALITTNAITLPVNWGKAEFFDAMGQFHRRAYGAPGDMNRRLVFCSDQFLSKISTMILGTGSPTNTSNSILTSWGANISTLTWCGWTWDFVLDPVLSIYRPGRAFVMQPRYVTFKQFRPTQFRANVQNPGDDFFKDEFLSEYTMETKLEELHGWLQG